MSVQLPDQAQRLAAIDPTRSCIVQAPAGSGKTELLIQRILSLLASVEQPEELLAITFTRKAAGEMKARLLDALSLAASGVVPESAHARQTITLATAVLAADRRHGWALVGNPARLQVQTIDSFCALLSRRMPYLSRFGLNPRLSDTPAELYRQAVEPLLARLEADDPEALGCLLRQVDNRLSTLRDLLVQLLGRRDQWLRHLFDVGAETARPKLEAGLKRYIDDVLAAVSAGLGASELDELVVLARFAAASHPDTVLAARLQALAGVPPADAAAVTDWQALLSLLLTSAGGLRRTVDARCGFPAGKDDTSRAMKRRMLELLERLRESSGLDTLLQHALGLPEPVYAEPQWQVLQALIGLLPQAVVELQAVFRQRGEVDFIEIAVAARQALGRVDAPEELLLQLDSRLRHILVDEFQDTSYGQYELLLLLTSGWERGDGRTLFVVGDPMQSIYRFREAEVGLYLRARSHGLDTVALQPLHLSANFRSCAELVDWFNSAFTALFPAREDEVRGAVPYASAVAILPGFDGLAVRIQPQPERDDVAEAQAILAIVRQALAADDSSTVAVLLRARSHAPAIIAVLKAAGLRFQAQEIDLLGERPVVQDLRALTRALLHLGDRVCWLALLRGPWCGLLLGDLLGVCEQAGKSGTIWSALGEGQSQPGLFAFSDDGQRRLARIVPVLEQALRRRGSLPLRQLVESTWVALGGPACVDAAGLADARRFLALLDEIDEGGDLPSLDFLDERLEGLYAAVDPEADGRLQLMTIHKAKGLEFDTVILPGLGRGVRRGDRPLLRWLEHPDYELLLAPIPPSDGSDEGATYKAIGRLQQEKDDYELLRLFYVAVTRARRQLHLLGHLPTNAKGEPSPESGSLFAAGWPALEDAACAALEQAEPAAAEQLSKDVEPAPLRRLPGDWTPPKLPRWQLPGLAEPARASDAAALDAAGFWFPGPARLIGVTVHAWLERIANDGIGKWEVARLKTLQPLLRRELAVAGVAAARLDAAVGQVLTCLKQALASQRGRWLLQAHPQAASEYALHGVIDGRTVHAVVDRTFVDAGCRWVIDYKTSSPEEGESIEAFLAREADRYRPQLQLYLQLFAAYDPDAALCGGLYFPMIDGWVKVAS